VSPSSTRATESVYQIMRVLLLSPLHPDALALIEGRHDLTQALDAEPDAVWALISDAEVVVLRSGIQLTRTLLDAAPKLELIIRAGSGLDNIDVEAARAHEIELVHIPEPSAQAVAELTLGLMIALSRRIVIADQWLRRGHWAKHQLFGSLLTGKTIGVVGAGNIGSRVGALATAWGMQALGCVEAPAADHEKERLQAAGILQCGLGELLASSDYVTVHVPLAPDTHHLISRDELRAMKSGAYLINMARGGVVDEQALYEELTIPRRLQGAALDVHEHEGEGLISPLASLENVVLTPHLGSMALETQGLIGQRVYETLEAYESRNT
jgi:D-3-phosphoglycerate dehydrogenase / 2-oxoglutarate reductase